MMNKMLMIYLNQLKAKNPQMYNMVSQAMQNRNDPMQLFKQITSNFDNNKKNAFFQQARQMGFSEELINQVQNGINT